MSNIIDKIQVSGVTYSISGGSGGGNPTVELTQAEYDALVSAGTVASDTYYIITDAQAGDLSNYWTSAQTQSAITEATSGKVDSSSVVSSVTSASTDSEIPTAKAVWDVASQGGGGGGTTYTAGRGIDITNDTISVSLPISAGTGTNSIAEGNKTTASGNYSHAEGYYSNAQAEASHAEGYSTAKETYCHSEGYATIAHGFRSHAEGAESVASGDTSHAEGKDTRTYNHAEHASGAFNVSSKASSTFGDSGNTLFSVGNGTANNARHNAFEIRQNGDIYLSSGGTDIKLQDHLGGIASGEVQTMIDESISGKADTSAVTTSIEAAVSGKADTSTTYTKTEVDNAITAATSTKQDTLVSGTNIKTINNESILGSGNITIQGGGETIDPTLDSGSTNAVANSAITEAVMVGEYTLKTKIPDEIQVEPFQKLLVEPVTSGAYADVTYLTFVISGNNNTTDALIVDSFSGHTIGTTPTYLNCTWLDDNYLLLTPKNNSNYITMVNQMWDTKNVYSIENLQSGSSSSIIENTIFPKIEDINYKLNTKVNTYISGTSLNNLYNDYGGYWYHELKMIDNTNRELGWLQKMKYSDFGLENDCITVKRTSAVTSASTSAETPSAKAVYESVSGKVDTSSMSGYVTTDTKQEITGNKTFIGSSSTSEKPIIFKQVNNSHKIGFVCRNSASTNNELATFEFRPDTYTDSSSVSHPLLYLGHYRNTNTANAGVVQTMVGFRQYDQSGGAAYHYLMPLPAEAKTPFSLTTSFKNYFAPLGFKNGSTMIKTDNTGVADFSDVLGGLKLVKLTQTEYDNLSTKDSNTLYVIVN